MAALVLLFAVGEALSAGPSPSGPGTTAEWLQVGATALMVGGAIAGWRLPRAGGSLLVGSALAFNAVESVAAGRAGVVWFTVPFALAGGLLLLGARARR